MNKLISKRWIERQKLKFVVIEKMKQRQLNLSFEEVYIEAMEQAKRMRV